MVHPAQTLKLTGPSEALAGLLDTLAVFFEFVADFQNYLTSLQDSLAHGFPIATTPLLQSITL